MDNDQPSQEELTKKERREVRRQESRDEQSRAARGRGAKRLVTWVIVFAVLGGIGWLVWRSAQNAPSYVTGGVSLTVPVSDLDNSKGDLDAPITLVEYGDYQCPACASFHPIVEQLFDDAQGQIRLVYRHFPLSRLHPNADMVSRAVESAGLQGKYWEMHNLVYERQQEWSPIPRSSARNKMMEYATELGLDAEKLDSDMDSDAVKDKIKSDIESGEATGVNSTPSFFVNGQRISDFSTLQDFQNKVLNGPSPQQESVPVAPPNGAGHGMEGGL